MPYLHNNDFNWYRGLWQLKESAKERLIKKGYSQSQIDRMLPESIAKR
jgi:SOS response regulatory protein OraA/RecX